MIRSKKLQEAVILANAVVITGALLIGILSGKPGLAFEEGELVTYFSTLQLGACAVASGFNCYFVFSPAKKMVAGVRFLDCNGCGLCLWRFG